MTSLTVVNIREATANDIRECQSSLLYRSATYLPWVGVQLWGTYQFWKNSDNLLNFVAPAVVKAAHYAQYQFGQKPEYPYINVRPTIFGDHYSLLESAAVKEFFKYHRNDPEGFFGPGKAVKVIGEILTKCFKDVKFEDAIFSCGPEQTTFLHSLLEKKMSPDAIKKYFVNIQEEAQKSLAGVTTETKTNFTDVAKLYVSRVFGETFFHDPDAGLGFLKHIETFKNYIIKKATKKGFTSEEIKNIDRMNFELPALVEKILQEPDMVEFFRGKELSSGQQKALIFTVFFAAIDNTSNLLAAAIHTLAGLDSDEQEHLSQIVQEFEKENPQSNGSHYPQELEIFVAKVFARYPVVVGVTRAVEKTICIEMTEAGKRNPIKIIIPAGSTLSGRIAAVAQKTVIGVKGSSLALVEPFSAFGGGKHRCPGRFLADVEMKEMIKQILLNYKISLEKPYDLTMRLQVTAILEQQVMAVLQRRNELGLK